ncbi:unnamed protein product [Amoebophrya sp. A120]|nr:unnamed protein product [Amoebophrya sp. A120]|eukprot:GSA120T00025414001.1
MAEDFHFLDGGGDAFGGQPPPAGPQQPQFGQQQHPQQPGDQPQPTPFGQQPVLAPGPSPFGNTPQQQPPPAPTPFGQQPNNTGFGSSQASNAPPDFFGGGGSAAQGGSAPSGGPRFSPFGEGAGTANSQPQTQPYINLQIDQEDVLGERAPSGTSGRGAQNSTMDAALDTRMGLFVQTATSGGSFKQVKPELAHKYGVDVGSARGVSVTQMRKAAAGPGSFSSTLDGHKQEGDRAIMDTMSTRASAATLKAVTLDFEVQGLKLQHTNDRDIFDLVVQAETTQEYTDQVFFGFQGMLCAAALVVLYVLFGYWSNPTDCLSLLKLFEPGLSRITFALAQIASVGALLRLVKCYEHLRAFEVFENNFTQLRDQAMEPIENNSSSTATTTQLAALNASTTAHQGKSATTLFNNYANLQLLSENRVPVVKQAGVCVAQAAANIAVVCLCMITSYNDMRIKNGYNQDFGTCPTANKPLTGTTTFSTGTFTTGGSTYNLATQGYTVTLANADAAAPACACTCADCCWKTPNYLAEFESSGFDSWRVQTMVKAIFALVAFALAVKERSTTFYYCTLPVIHPRGI